MTTLTLLFYTIVIGVAMVLADSDVPFCGMPENPQEDASSRPVCGHLYNEAEHGESKDAPVPKLWPDGIVYYKLDPNVYNKTQKERLEKTMGEMMESTKYDGNYPIAFKPIQDTHGFDHYIEFVKEDSICGAYLGAQEADQLHKVFFGDGCFTNYPVSTQYHELMHVLGFIHEHQRVDRDADITVNFTAIPNGQIGGYTRNTGDFWSGDYVVKSGRYDYFSVLHYGSSDIGCGTIIKTVRGNDLERPEDGLSPMDIYKIRKFYGKGNPPHPYPADLG